MACVRVGSVNSCDFIRHVVYCICRQGSNPLKMGVPKRVPSLNTQVEGKCRELGGINAIHRCAFLARLPYDWRFHCVSMKFVQPHHMLRDGWKHQVT